MLHKINVSKLIHNYIRTFSFITQISRTHKFQTSTFREISSIPIHKNTTPAPPAPDLLVNPRSISTEGKYRTPYSERLMCQNKEQPSFINRKHTHTHSNLSNS